MTKILIDEATVKLVLDALDVATTPFARDRQEVLRAQAALREALAEQPAQQEPVAPTAVEMQNAAANLALMREMWGNSDEPAAKVNDDGFIVETGLLLSPGTQLYTSPPAQRKWVGLSEEDREQHRNDWHSNIHDKEFQAIEAKLKEKNNG